MHFCICQYFIFLCFLPESDSVFLSLSISSLQFFLNVWLVQLLEGTDFIFYVHINFANNIAWWNFIVFLCVYYYFKYIIISFFINNFCCCCWNNNKYQFCSIHLYLNLHQKFFNELSSNGLGICMVIEWEKIPKSQTAWMNKKTATFPLRMCKHNTNFLILSR